MTYIGMKLNHNITSFLHRQAYASTEPLRASGDGRIGRPAVGRTRGQRQLACHRLHRREEGRESPFVAGGRPGDRADVQRREARRGQTVPVPCQRREPVWSQRTRRDHGANHSEESVLWVF